MTDAEHADEQPGSAERAFEDLRAEVSVTRRAVETMSRRLDENQPPDYSLDLGRMAKGLAVVSAQLDAINKHPALRMTPELHRQAIAQAGNEIMRDAAQKLDRATADAERERQRLAGLIGNARRQDQQRTWLIYTGLAAFVVALLVSPCLYALLPFGLNSRVAALVMNTDRWNAGQALMRADSPDGWNSAVNAWNLVRANQMEIAACNEAAVNTKKDQRCVITVPAGPAQ
jgi:hypothetical protein